MITWECDYPHSDSTWPEAPERLWRVLDGLPDRDINKLTHENAMRIFQYDPFSLIPREQSTVAALRSQATHVDLTLIRDAGGKPPGHKEGEVVRMAQVVKQLSGAFDG